uniref:Uncharacterized protein n=1 Tax=Triticum urartu TaxID=4572 RepID=A0A8R7PEG0_TRIUA
MREVTMRSLCYVTFLLILSISKVQLSTSVRLLAESPHGQPGAPAPLPPGDLPGNIPANVPASMSDNIPGNLPASLPENMPVNLPANVPPGVLANVPPGMLASVPPEMLANLSTTMAGDAVQDPAGGAGQHPARQAATKRDARYVGHPRGDEAAGAAAARAACCWGIPGQRSGGLAADPQDARLIGADEPLVPADAFGVPAEDAAKPLALRVRREDPKVHQQDGKGEHRFLKKAASLLMVHARARHGLIPRPSLP